MTREITVRGSSLPADAGAAPTRYVSIFEDPTRFADQLKVAEMLSRTTFVPKAFQGKPDDCLVALDMAGRLDLNPLAVFPDIYVIDGRSSFSSKFLIALVNRSGRFTRIEFETGVNGEADVTFGAWEAGARVPKKWKQRVPNYFAKARFTEIASGRTFESPLVDMNFAEKNQWVEKPGSKWQSMPEIMTRYRAASILIKSVCPEIVMGLEFSEDLQDATDTSTAREVILETPQRLDKRAITAPASAPAAPKKTIDLNNPPDDLSLDEMLDLLESATTLQELKTRGKFISDYELDASDAATLRAKYKSCAAALALAQAQVIPPKTGQAGEPVFNANAARAAIDKAATNNDLDAVVDEIDAARQDGRLDSSVDAELKTAISKRRGEIATDAAIDETPGATPTNEQLAFETNLRDALVEAAKNKDSQRLEKNGALITDWAEQGYLTDRQASVLFAQFNELKKGLES